MGRKSNPIVPLPWLVRLFRDEIGAASVLTEAAFVVCAPVGGATDAPTTCPLWVDRPFDTAPGPFALARSRCRDPPLQRLTPAIRITASARPVAAPRMGRLALIGEPHLPSGSRPTSRSASSSRS